MTMTTHERQMRIMDVGFQIETGRANLEVEETAAAILGVDGLRGLGFALRTASDEIVRSVWTAVCGNGRSVMGLK
jgi:hypothetical protein